MENNTNKYKFFRSYGLGFERNNNEQIVQDILNNMIMPKFIKEEKNSDATPFNYLLKGDNLTSLILLQTANIKIDVIYIDPPYNTGKEFVYNDKIVDENDGFKHSKWLNFMYKRLIIAKDLLADNGVIFISINDYEFAQLKLLCDEIFGEKNFIANFIWKMYAGVHNDANNVSKNTEYVLCYAKNINSKKNLLDNEEYDKSLKYKFNDNDGRGAYALTPIEAKGESKSSYIYTFKNGITFQARPGTHIRYSLENLKNLENEGRIVFSKNGNPQVKKYLSEVKAGRKISTLLETNEVGYTTNGTQELKRILGQELGSVFENPKPSSLIKKLLSLFKSRKEITVLDFFAGSGTTGQAVLELNKELGTNFRFILATNNDNRIFDDITLPRTEAVIKQQDLKDKANIRVFETELIPYKKDKFNNLMRIKPYFKDFAYLQFDEMTKISSLPKIEVFKDLSKDKYVFATNNYLSFEDEQNILNYYQANNLQNAKIKIIVFSISNTISCKSLKELKNIEFIFYPNSFYNQYRRIRELLINTI